MESTIPVETRPLGSGFSTRTTKRWLIRIGILIGLIAAFAILRLTLFQPDPLVVTVHVVDRGQVDETVVNSRAGSILSRREAGLSPSLSGLVEEVLAKKGARVAEGDILLRIHDDEYQAELLLASRALTAAKGTEKEACLRAAQSERSYQRSVVLAADGLISNEAFEEMEITRDIATTECSVSAERRRQAAANLDVVRATLNKTLVRAPFDGTLASVDVERGEWVGPSSSTTGMLAMAPIMKLVDLDDLYVSAPIDEVDAVSLSVGQKVRVVLDALPGRSISATLTWISPIVDTEETQNRTIEVEATFVEDSGLSGVLPGLSADIEVILESRSDVIRIPTYAVFDGDKVLVVSGDHLEEVQVEPGLRNWQLTEIKSGLEAGQRVVTSLDREEIQAGARVETRIES